MNLASLAAAATAIFALLFDLGALLSLHDLVYLPDWLNNKTTHSVSVVLKLLALLWFSRQFKLPFLFHSLLWLIGAILLQPVLSQFIPRLINLLPDDGEIPTVLITPILNLIAGGVFAIIIAIFWFTTATNIFPTKSQEKFRGYGQPLGVATALIAIAMLIYFLETPKLLGHVLFDIALGGLMLSLLFPALALGKKSRRGLYLSVLVVPGLLYISPLIFGIGAIVEDNRENFATASIDPSPVTQADNLQALLDNTLTKYNKTQSLRLFNDYWLFTDGRQLAVDDSGIYERITTDAAWNLVYPNKDPDSESFGYIRFDQTGQRGVLGIGYDVSRSLDGGKTWQRLNTHRVFKKLSGRDFGDKLLDDYSAVFLDPDTGNGSFSMGCAFFESKDFGESWIRTLLVSAEDKKRCLTASPFALDSTQGLAVATSLGTEFVLRRMDNDDNKLWDSICRLDDMAMMAVGAIPLCDKEGVLTESELQFVAKNSYPQTRQQLDQSEDVIERIIAGETIAVADYSHALRDNGKQQWLSGPGYLIMHDDATGQFVTDHRVPELRSIFPIDSSSAVGMADGVIYQTSNTGLIWTKLEKPADYQTVLLQPGNSDIIYLEQDSNIVKLQNNRLTTLMTLPEYGGIEMAHSSTDGTRLLLVTYDAYSYYYSADAGANWQQFDTPVPEPKEPENDDEDVWDASPTAFDCYLEQQNICLVIYDDNRSMVWPASAPETAELQADLKIKDDHELNGNLAILNDSYMYLPGYTSQLHQYSEGKWQMERLPLVVDEWSYTTPTVDRSKLFLTSNNSMLVIDQSAQYLLFDSSDWNEDDIDTTVEFCTDESGELILLSSDTGQLAISIDGGNSWHTHQTVNQTSSACGLHKQGIWLYGDTLSVYQRN